MTSCDVTTTVREGPSLIRGLAFLQKLGTVNLYPEILYSLKVQLAIPSSMGTITDSHVKVTPQNDLKLSDEMGSSGLALCPVFFSIFLKEPLADRQTVRSFVALVWKQYITLWHSLVRLPLFDGSLLSMQYVLRGPG